VDHKPGEDDRCACGGIIVYFEDARPSGEGCDQQGHPWDLYVDTNLAADAYEWLSDCGLIDDETPVDDWSYQHLATIVNKTYEGGWHAFVRDNAPELLPKL
jgi:hypothetical protein